MKTLAFVVSLDDLVEFTLSRNERSEPLQRMHRVFRWMFSLGLAGVVCGVGLALDLPVAVAIGAVGGVFYWYRYPKAAASAQRKHAYRIYRAQEAELGLGANHLAFDGQVLEHRSPRHTSRIPVWSIENVERHPGRVYLVMQGDGGIVIPTLGLDPQEVQAFRAELERRRTSA